MAKMRNVSFAARHAISDGEDRPGTAGCLFLLHLALDSLDNRLARSSIRGIVQRLSTGRSLPDHEQLPVADQERAAPTVMGSVATLRAMGGQVSTRWLYPGLVPRRPVRHGTEGHVTAAAFLKRIWQLGNFDVSPTAGCCVRGDKGDQWSVYLLDLRTKKDESSCNPSSPSESAVSRRTAGGFAVQSDSRGREYNIYLVPVRANTSENHGHAFDSASLGGPPRHKIAFLSNRDGDRDNVFVWTRAARCEAAHERR